MPKNTILKTGIFFQRHLPLILEHGDLITSKPELFYVSVPHLYIRDDLSRVNISVYLGTMLKIWQKRMMIDRCAVCGEDDSRFYFMRLTHWDSRPKIDETKTSVLYGVCPTCRAFVVHNLKGDERFTLNRYRVPPELGRWKLDKMFHMDAQSHLSPDDLVARLGGASSEGRVKLPNPTMIKSSGLSEEEIARARDEAARAASGMDFTDIPNYSPQALRERHAAARARRASS